jgi:hypothetical protein
MNIFKPVFDQNQHDYENISQLGVYDLFKSSVGTIHDVPSFVSAKVPGERSDQ